MKCLWHPKLNQIFVGCSNGLVKVLFSDKHSQRGAKMCLAKHKKKKIVESITAAEPRIVTRRLMIIIITILLVLR